MYVPPHAREERTDVLIEAIHEIAFGTLVTVRDGRAELTRLPMMIVERGDAHVIIGHVSRANEQWKATSGSEAVASFVGPSFYVSPNVYATKTLTQKVVPTWNYIAVEVRGAIDFFDDRDRLHALVTTLTDRHESKQANSWSVDDAPQTYIEAQLRGIVGFELRVDSMLGAWKLGLNRSADDRNGIADMMERSEDPSVRARAASVRP
jgi:transcriptional regulator